MVVKRLLIMRTVCPTSRNLSHSNGDGTFTDAAASASLNVTGCWVGLAFDNYINDGDGFYRLW